MLYCFRAGEELWINIVKHLKQYYSVVFFLLAFVIACNNEPPVIDKYQQEKEELLELGITLDQNLTLLVMRRIVQEREELVSKANEVGISNSTHYSNKILTEKIAEAERMIVRK